MTLFLPYMQKNDTVETQRLFRQLHYLNRWPEPKFHWYESLSHYQKRFNYNRFDKSYILQRRFSRINRDWPFITVGNGFFCPHFWSEENHNDTVQFIISQKIINSNFLVATWQENVHIIKFPKIVEVDNENRLHNELGPSVEFLDRTVLYHWHGQEIPPKWIEQGLPEPAQLLKWRNLDERSAGCAMLGWNRLREVCKSKTIEDSGDPLWGELVEMQIPNSGKEKFLFVTCGTGREFALPVPPTVQTVDQAQSAIHGGLPPEILKFSVART